MIGSRKVRAVALLTPLLGLPAGLAVVSWQALGVPAFHLPAPASDKTAPAPIARTYLSFPDAITVTLPKGRGTLRLTVVLAVPRDLAPGTVARLKMTPDQYFPALGSLLLDMSGDSDIPALRAAIPDAFRQKLNSLMERDGLGHPILEVLMPEFAILR